MMHHHLQYLYMYACLILWYMLLYILFCFNAWWGISKASNNSWTTKINNKCSGFMGECNLPWPTIHVYCMLHRTSSISIIIILFLVKWMKCSVLDNDYSWSITHAHTLYTLPHCGMHTTKHSCTHYYVRIAHLTPDVYPACVANDPKLCTACASISFSM